ncbi:MAG: response regulator [Salinivirgaceae bacterium]|nr:response regulator [Salinivirgaceae bacterium]
MKKVTATYEDLLKENESLKQLLLNKNEIEESLKAQQLLFETMFNTISDGVVVTNTKREILLANDGMKTTFGYKPEDIIGKSTQILYADSEKYAQTGNTVFNKEAKPKENWYTTYYKDYNNTVFPGETFGSKLYNNKGEWIGNVGIMRNISERVKTIEDLNLAKKKLEKLNSNKDRFISILGHELRTPLHAILGFTKIIQRNNTIPVSEKKNLEIVKRSGQHLLNLINKVIDFSKNETEQQKLEISAFNLKNTVSDIVEIMKQNAHEKGLLLQYSQQNNLPVFVKTDELKLKQILINLIGNAIKYTDKGTVEFITNTIKETENGKANLVFKIRDTGIGIHSSEINKIFEPFYQTGDFSSKEGTGLGLTICKQFTELLGGKITVESTVNFGTTFTVVIPMIIADKSEFKKDKFKVIKSLANEEPAYKILIVENQKENWMILEQILEKVGFKVKLAVNGQEGIDIYTKWNPQLIFMDIRMPVMDGLVATKIIRQFEKGTSVKIIGVSAHVSDEKVQNVYAAGMDDFIKKPFQFNDIYSCLQKHLGVKYIYDESSSTTEVEGAILATEMFSEIDSSTLSELMQAIENLDSQKLNELINIISAQNEELANILNCYVSNFRYTEIFKILKKLNPNMNKG